MRCSRCNAVILENSGYCSLCGTPVPGQEKKANVGLAVLSFFIPLVGLIVYLVKKDEDPKTAKLSGKCALISVVVQVVLSLVMFLCTIGLVVSKSSLDEIQFDEPLVDASSDYSDDEYIYSPDGSEYVAGQLVVCFKDNVTSEYAYEYIESLDGKIIRNNDLMKTYVAEFDIDDYDSLVAKKEEVAKSNLVAFAELNEVIEYDGVRYSNDMLV